MSATLTRRFLFARKAHALLHFLHLDLMLAGLLVGIALTNVVLHRVELLASLNAALPTQSSPVESLTESETPEHLLHPELTPPMRVALDSVARRFRVSNQALLPIFEAAQVAGRERHLDPVLLIAIIKIGRAHV